MKKNTRFFIQVLFVVALLAIFFVLFSKRIVEEIPVTLIPPTTTPVLPTDTVVVEHTIAPTETARFIGMCSEDNILNVYSPNLFHYTVTKQPINEPAFVTEEKDTITQFRLASEYGSIGLIAHNYLAGSDFPQIDIGQSIVLICAHPTPFTYIELYTVVEILRFQALQPFSPLSDFVDVDTGIGYTSTELFNLIYNRLGYLILQTSIATEESGAWGRLFIIAERK